MPERLSDSPEYGYFHYFRASFRSFSAATHDDIVTVSSAGTPRHPASQPPRLLRLASRGREDSHGPDFSVVSAGCTGRRRLHLAFGDHLRSFLRAGPDGRGSARARSAELSVGDAHRPRCEASDRADERTLLFPAA